MTEKPVETRRIRLSPTRSLETEGVVRALAEKGVGEFPGMEDLVRPLPRDTADVTEQFFAVSPADGTVLGFCSLSRLDTGRRWIQVDVVVDEGSNAVGIALEATVLTVDHAFRAWPVDEVRFWSAGDRATGLRNHPTMVVEEDPPAAGLPRSPGLEDASHFVIQRARWERYGAKFVQRLSQAPSSN
ncbi:GNAT family N-acetyltransferase [Nocardiopsis sp. CA-288880]|uniref:GNAT family N-acetyltransferase n=1 Tax=Nocardiopsis sp. CA-288880 TaxID=3239995 RepID=UPI003D997431